jgi:predicted enzyme related to lactoylglutathione lyase
MPERTEYPAGLASWVDLAVHDVEAAQHFYGELLDWKFDSTEDGRYTYCLKDGRKVAGLYGIPQGSQQPPAWNTYLGVDDLDAEVAKVTGLGATVVKGPKEYVDGGRVAVITDTCGATVCLREPGSLPGYELVNEIGATCWHELVIRDGAAAEAFWGKVFPYQFYEVDHSVAIIRLGKEPVGGRHQMPYLPAEFPSQWGVYFWVEDTDAAAAKVTELGGKITFGPKVTPHGPLAQCVDPFGARFTVIVSSEW